MHTGFVPHNMFLKLQFFQEGQRLTETREDERIVVHIPLKGPISARIINNENGPVRIWFSSDINAHCPPNTPMHGKGEAMPYTHTPAYGTGGGLFYCLIQKEGRRLECIPIQYEHEMPPVRAQRLSEIASC